MDENGFCQWSERVVFSIPHEDHRSKGNSIQSDLSMSKDIHPNPEQHTRKENLDLNHQDSPTKYRKDTVI